jgi:prolyl 4-hydroxylase
VSSTSFVHAFGLIISSQGAFTPSKIVEVDYITGVMATEGTLNYQYRSSKSAVLERIPLVECIENRAANFQGIPVEHLEPMQVVKYGRSDYFNAHHDWFGHDSESLSAGDRETTFFVYLDADCAGGMTQFPEWPLPEDMSDAWCEVLDCEKSRANGLTWKARRGNAIFWQNLHPNGSGIEQTLHTGLPVESGSKVGLNIWTREKAWQTW